MQISLTFDGFTLMDAGADHLSPTEGHIHVSVDGTEPQMYFVPEIDLTGVAPGPHQLSVTLQAPGHTTYSIAGVPLTYAEEFVVPGEVAVADVVISIVVDADGNVASTVKVEASSGDIVKVTIDSDVDEELHVHPYERVLHVRAGEPAELQFIADIPGVFEIELEGSSTLVAELTVR